MLHLPGAAESPEQGAPMSTHILYSVPQGEIIRRSLALGDQNNVRDVSETRHYLQMSLKVCKLVITFVFQDVYNKRQMLECPECRQKVTDPIDSLPPNILANR